MGFNLFALSYFLLLNIFYIFLIGLSALQIRKYLKSLAFGGYDRIFSDLKAPTVSILVPVFNEEVNIELTVRNMLHIRYSRYEVIVINDGSKDGILEILKKNFIYFR